MSNQDTIPTIDEMKYSEVGHALPHFERNVFVEDNQIYLYAKEYDYTGVYRSAYRYNVNSKENIRDAYLFSHFYIDFDNKDDIEKAREDLLFIIWKMSLKTTYNLPLESFRIYFSGMKGFHLLIPYQYLGIKPSKHLDELFKWIAVGLHQESVNETIDMVVYERRRMWRLENSKHPETNLYKIPLQYKELLDLSIEEIMALAKQPRYIEYPQPYLVESARKEYLNEAREMVAYKKEEAERFKNYKPTKLFKPGEVPDYVQALIDEGPVNGFRNETATALASFYYQQGLPKEEAFNELLAWNGGSLSESDLKISLNSVYNNGYTYGKRRFKALLDKDLTLIDENHPKKRGVLPPWKKKENT